MYARGVPEARYRSDPTARATLDRLAGSTRGSVFSEGDLRTAIQEGRRRLGDGPTIVRGDSRSRFALAPYLAFVAFLPLTLLLGRPDI